MSCARLLGTPPLKNSRSPRAEFDAHAADYEADLQASLPEMLSEGDYYSRYKVEIVFESQKRTKSLTILDFGCGVGLTLQLFSDYFPDATLWGYDVSLLSIEHARQRVPFVSLTANLRDLPEEYFDVVFVANVLHHIPRDARLPVIKMCRNLLKDTGRIYVFEHNPYNPVTRGVFERCPFDQEAEMLSRGALLELASLADLSVAAKRYTLFFPKQLAVLRRMESLLGWLPIGAQYCVELCK
jgi:SAM-dependent methyltransferase